VQRSRARARGKLRAAAPFALARLFLMPRLPALLRDHPELELELVLENRTPDLLREGLDCAITYGAPNDPELVARRLASTHLITCAAPSYLREHGTPSNPEALSAHVGIAFATRASSRAATWKFLRNGTAFEQRVGSRLRFNSMEACVDAAAAGLGITQVLSTVAMGAIRTQRVAPVLLDFASPGPELYLAYPPTRQASARQRAFAEFVLNAFAEIDTGWAELSRRTQPAPRRKARRRR
jgi:LysR family transcriptional regulator for bpeEF and oprC